MPRIGPGNVPHEVRSSGGTLINYGPGTLYYGDDQNVSVQNYEGSLGVGQTNPIRGTLWLVAPVATDVGVIADPSADAALFSSGGGVSVVASTAAPPGDITAGEIYLQLNPADQTKATKMFFAPGASAATIVDSTSPPGALAANVFHIQRDGLGNVISITVGVP